MKIQHPEQFILLFGFIFMITTAVLHILGFFLGKPQLFYWGRWACFAMIATAFTPLLAILFDLIEKFRGKRHD